MGQAVLLALAETRVHIFGIETGIAGALRMLFRARRSEQVDKLLAAAGSRLGAPSPTVFDLVHLARSHYRHGLVAQVSSKQNAKCGQRRDREVGHLASRLNTKVFADSCVVACSGSTTGGGAREGGTDTRLAHHNAGLAHHTCKASSRPGPTWVTYTDRCEAGLKRVVKQQAWRTTMRDQGRSADELFDRHQFLHCLERALRFLRGREPDHQEAGADGPVDDDALAMATARGVAFALDRSPSHAASHAPRSPGRSCCSPCCCGLPGGRQ